MASSSSAAADSKATAETKTSKSGEPLTQSWVELAPPDALGLALNPRVDAALGPSSARNSNSESGSDREPTPQPQYQSLPELQDWSAMSASSSSRLSMAVPSRLGSVTMTELLENDGLCLMFRAWHDGLKLPVVVKVLMESIYGELAEAKAALRRDFHILRTLAHPSLMRIWDFCEDQGFAYLVMEDYDGPSIGDMLQLGLRFRVNRALEILDQAIEALWIARMQGVLHLRLCPARLRLPKMGLARISELGLSGLAPLQAARIADSHLERDPGCLKAAPYLSPEQAEGAIGDQRSDIYSLGAMTYHALTGEPPFVAASSAGILAKARKQEPADPARLNREVDRDVSDLVLRMMARSPDHRFSDYDVLRIALIEVAKRRIASGSTQDINGRSPLWGRVMRIELNLPPDPRLEKTSP